MELEFKVFLLLKEDLNDLVFLGVGHLLNQFGIATVVLHLSLFELERFLHTLFVTSAFTS